MAKRGDKAAKPAPEAKPKRVRKPRVSKPVLGDEAREHIVTGLATFVPVVRLQEQISERFGVELSHQAVSYYNPENGREDLGQRWIDLFQATRKAFIEEIGLEPIAHRAYRLRSLQQQHDKLLADFEAASSPGRLEISQELRGVLAQAAQEVGGKFTNITKSESQSLIAVVPVTTDEKRNVLAERIAQAMQKALPAPKEG